MKGSEAGAGTQYGGLDWFRIISAILVITIHTSPLLCIGEEADFILTRVIARVAVPFFFMVSGFFLLPDIRWNEDQRHRVWRQIGKLGFLYLIATLLYVPLRLYSGTLGTQDTFGSVIKDILFDGTFYHLWYLPAAMLGLMLTAGIIRHSRVEVGLLLSLVLYLFGLLGDSYYGLAQQIEGLRQLYVGLFQVMDYTRNGIFFAPLFLVLGCRLKQQAEQGKIIRIRYAGLGTVLSLLAMTAEALVLRQAGWQRHDSMYGMLPVVMWFLFQWVIQWKGAGGKRLGRIALVVYIIHPAMIVAVRLVAKITGKTAVMVDQSLVHFLLVMLLSFIAAYVITMFGWKKKKDNRIHKRAWTEVSLENLEHNVREIQDILPPETEFMAVVKANGYGSGDIRIAGYLNKLGIRAFAVATLEEGIHLRKNGIAGMILILGYTDPAHIREIERYRLTQTLTDYEYGKALEACKRHISVHIKLDTGMHRLGEDYRDYEHLVKLYQFRHLKVEGIYTHLCVADSLEPEDIAFTHQQIRHYYDALEYLKKQGIQPGKTHIQSSYGVLNYPELRCDYARIGIAMYGVLSRMDEVKLSVDLRPVMTVKSQVAAIKLIHKGESVGYGRTYIADSDRRIAVVTIGYADGVPRELSCGKGQVLINGQEAEIIGRICMDQMMIDVTEIPRVKVGDVVTVIGGDVSRRIPAERVAMESDTITNELLSRLGDRLERLYL